MASPRQNPREMFLTGRERAADGVALYGKRFLISLPDEVQERVEQLADAWQIPRAEMVRYLVIQALPRAEKQPIPLLREDQKEETK